ncbi:MAG: nuclear transport factor 2 family protein [Cyanobacteria bacterium J06621_15]
MGDINSSREALERELQEMDIAFLNAVLNHDVSYVERTLPSDFLSVFPDGRVADKAAELENVKNVELESFSTDDIQVHWYGNTVAIINFRLSLKMQGQDTKQVRDSHVYVQRDGRWQMVMGQTTPILT